MGWVQFFGILVPLVAFSGFLYREIKEWRLETKEEIKSIREESRFIQAEIREETKSIREEMQQQAARSDRLYEMFIDLLKDTRRTRTDP